ncbi:alkylation response protein AidB-like acyl-CoA dehydrogenase [Kribbella voronezhensis]|uniref:Alkylation response protein AidB-like acyl-CoA dehydrogenase n=1 Tax=Kribbella voronezhensis TaxID=2512212 RepID=A0A4R7T799_9ACTN|nr:acyl-CoA dehydrogenase [Kribbella voronezhensis]TDU87754.1 alkylation response protein AidB-like acyl-CoA dehydrogenase [Kribbella voronezhensis]
MSTATHPEVRAGRSSVHETVEDFEEFLGDPRDPGSRITFAEQMEYDEREEKAVPAFDALAEWGYPLHYVPAAEGGRFHDMERMFGLIRSLARRDMTPALSSGATFLGAMPVWGWGDAAQRARVAELIKAGAFGAFGLSEADHGCDVVAGEVLAEGGDEAGYLLTGTKWPIGNGIRSTFATIFARTGPAGPRGFSAFLVDKEKLDPLHWATEPRVKTLGLRGADVSGITLEDCPVPADAVIGSRGRGMEEAIKTLQISRTLVTAMSMGVADTGLRTTLDHIRSRRLYGRTVHEIQVIREQVLAAYVDLLVAECTTAATARAISVMPERLSLWSSVTKYLVPGLIDEVLGSLGSVLAARHFMREGVNDGIFQKMLRDNRIVSIFEGTSHVHQHVVASQLPSLLLRPEYDLNTEALLQDLYDHEYEPAEWDLRFDRFKLTNGGLDEITQSLPDVVAAIPAEYATLKQVAAEVLAVQEKLQQGIRQLVKQGNDLHSNARGFTLARQHCLVHAAAACLHTWNANAGRGGFVGRPEWVVLALQRILTRLIPDQQLDPDSLVVVEAEMLSSWEDERLFSLVPLRLGGTGTD